MSHPKFATALFSLAVLAALAGCGWRAQPAEPPARPAPAPAATPASGNQPGALPRPRAQPEACIREGEACKAAGSVCCTGLICTGSASGICISRH